MCFDTLKDSSSAYTGSLRFRKYVICEQGRNPVLNVSILPDMSKLSNRPSKNDVDDWTIKTMKIKDRLHIVPYLLPRC